MKFSGLLVVLLLVVGLHLQLQAQDKRLVAQAFHNYDSTLKGGLREIPSDSTFYTYSGTRSGDWEKGIFYDQKKYFNRYSRLASSDFLPTTYSVRVYDSRNNILADTVYLWDDQQQGWQYSSLMLYTYNANNRVLTEVGQLWDGSNYRNYTRVTNSYTAFDSLERTTYEDFADNTWRPRWRYTYSYDANHNRIRNDAEEGLKNGTWQSDYTETWDYDNKNRVVREENNSGGTIRITRRYFDAQDYLIATTYDETSTIIRSDSTAYIYNHAHDSLTVMVRMEIKGYPASIYKSSEQTFDSKKNVLSILSYQQDQGKDIPSALQRFSYDAQGRRSKDSVFIYVAGKAELQDITTYTYDNFNKLARQESWRGTSVADIRLYNVMETERISTGQLSRIRHSRIIDTMGTWNVVGVNLFYYSISTTVEDDEQTAFILYPNPAAQTVYIESADAEPILGVRVYDMIAKNSFAVQSDILGGSIRLSTAQLPTGSYIVAVRSAKGVRHLRFVKD